MGGHRDEYSDNSMDEDDEGVTHHVATSGPFVLPSRGGRAETHISVRRLGGGPRHRDGDPPGVPKYGFLNSLFLSLIVNVLEPHPRLHQFQKLSLFHESFLRLIVSIEENSCFI